MKNIARVLVLVSILVTVRMLHAEEKKISETALNDSLTVAYGEFTLKHYIAAMAKYEAILALDSGNGSAKLYTALIKMEWGKYDEAYAVMKQLADKYPDWMPGNVNAGWYAFLVKKFKESKEYLDKAYKQDSTSLALRINLGHLALAQGRVKEAEAWYLPAIHEIPSRKAYERHFGKDLDTYLPRIIKADVLKKEKKWIEAEFAKQEKLWRKNDDVAKPSVDLANEAYNAEKYSDAIAQIEKIIALTPDNASAYLLLAECWQKQGDKEKYNQYQGKALEVDEELSIAYLNSGIEQYNNKQYLEAVNNLRLFLNYDEGRNDDQTLRAEQLIAESHFYVANTLMTEQNDYERARAIFNMMLANREHLYPSRSRNGMLVLIHDDPKGDAIIKAGIARTYVLEKRGDEAKPYLQEAMELDASNADVYFLQGMIAFQAGNQDLCFEKLKKAARLGSEEAKDNLTKNGVEY
jgi:tetratricopeptide (TPR) repeat protein